MDDLLLLPDWAALVAATNWDDDPLRLSVLDAPAPAREPFLLRQAQAAAREPAAATTWAGHTPRIEATQQPGERFLLVALGPAVYALGLASLIEVSHWGTVTPLPNLPAWLLGVMNLRGDIFSVIDLRAFLGVTAPPVSRRARLVLVRAPQQALATALLVDQVREMCHLTAAQIQPGATPKAPYLAGQAEYKGQTIQVLDVAQLLLVSRDRLSGKAAPR